MSRQVLLSIGVCAVGGSLACMQAEVPVQEAQCNLEGLGGEPVQQLVGLSEDAANEHAQAEGYSVRIAGRDGECFVLTTDLQPDRLNLEVWEGTVVDASLG